MAKPRADLNTQQRRRRSARERFDEKWTPVPFSGCWIWMGALFNTGYGAFGMGRRVVSAHRASWLLHNGEPPDGAWVLHRCDVRACVNPRHLYVGDIFDNARDLWERGSPRADIRAHVTPEVERRRVASLPRGRDHHRSNATLTEADAITIYRCTDSQRAIAERYGITQQAVSKIKRRLNWSHIHADR